MLQHSLIQIQGATWTEGERGGLIVNPVSNAQLVLPNPWAGQPECCVVRMKTECQTESQHSGSVLFLWSCHYKLGAVQFLWEGGRIESTTCVGFRVECFKSISRAHCQKKTLVCVCVVTSQIRTFFALAT